MNREYRPMTTVDLAFIVAGVLGVPAITLGAIIGIMIGAWIS